MAYIQERKSEITGKVSYRVQVRMKGYPTQSATFDRITDAKEWAKETEVAIKHGKYFKTAEAKKHTLADMIDRYLKDVLPNKPKSEVTQGGQLRHWKKEIGHLVLSDVTPARIVEQRDKLKASGKSAATVNRYLAALSHVFTIGAMEWEWVEENPLRKVSRPKEPRGRTRFLSDEERAELLRVCKAKNIDLYTAVVLALSTGARKMEIWGMKWNQVDFNRNVITLHDTKNKERRVLPLAGHALELMQERMAQRRTLNSDLVFPSPKNPEIPYDMRVPWKEAVKEAKIKDFRWHDLRHSAASYLAMNGATLAEIAEILGHKTLQMVKRYSHLSEAHTAKVVAGMNDKIFSNSN